MEGNAIMCNDYETLCDDFETRNKADWAEAINKVFGDSPPQSAKWTDPLAMIRVLTPFMGDNRNHTMLPGGGGMDMESVAQSPESGCLEFCPGNCLADTFRPAVLYFEHFPESAWNSFFLLETQTLEPCGVYEESDGAYEEVTEVSPGEYIDRHHSDTGILGYDENGKELPLPPTARIISRRLQGKFLIVAKESIWNLVSATYDGRHNHMSAQQIRDQIQRAIDEYQEAL